MVHSIKKLSVVIPLYNEERNAQELYSRLKKVLKDDCSLQDYEIIFVDDGSHDGTYGVLRASTRGDEHVCIIKFTRNFGQHPATIAGLSHASGDAIILMDGDLQNPPEEIPKLLSEYSKGFDVVYGIRSKRSDSFLRMWGSALYSNLINKLLSINNPDPGASLRMLSSRVVQELLLISEPARYISPLVAWMGFKSSCVTVRHDDRKKGTSSYSYIRLIVMTFELIMGFSPRILRSITFFGIGISCLSFLLGFYFLVLKLMGGTSVPGYTSLIVIMTFFFGILFIFLGLISEYIARLFHSSQGKPRYVVDAIIGAKPLVCQKKDTFLSIPQTFKTSTKES